MERIYLGANLPGSLVGLDLLGLGWLLVGYTSFVWLMKHASPTLVSTYGYINPMIAVFLGWWVLGEQVGPRMLIASATIIAGVVMISWSKR